MSLQPHSHPTRTRGAHLAADGVSKTFPDRRVLTDVSFAVPAGDRAALIGENGSGKSTLLRIVAGVDRPDAGLVNHPGDVGLHHQQPPFPLDLSAEAVLDDATRPVGALTEAVSRLGERLADAPDDTDIQAEFDLALRRAEHADAWNVDHTAEMIRDGLGILSVPGTRPMNELSGGQVARFSLAWTLLRHPFTLLLDEPTNHLDDRGAAVLARMLRTWNGPVLLASHDRSFLDETITSLIDLDPHPVAQQPARGRLDPGDPGFGFGVTRFTGNYSDYIAARHDTRDRWEQRYLREQEELRVVRQAVHDSHRVGHPERGPRMESRMARKFYSDRNAKVTSRRVNDARSALDRLESEAVRKPPPELRFCGLSTGSTRKPPRADAALTAVDVTVPGRLASVSAHLTTAGRLLIEGPNGCGKSTLLKVLSGQQQPDGGSLTRAPGLSIALLDQDPTPIAPFADLTAAQAYAVRVGEQAAEAVPLTTFGLLPGRDQNRPVASLSVGQLRRLDLAVLLADPPEVLLLDEPTNHFSLALAEDLERSIATYPGAVVVASHDRMLRRRWGWERLRLTDPAAR